MITAIHFRRGGKKKINNRNKVIIIVKNKLEKVKKLIRKWKIKINVKNKWSFEQFIIYLNNWLKLKYKPIKFDYIEW